MEWKIRFCSRYLTTIFKYSIENLDSLFGKRIKVFETFQHQIYDYTTFLYVY